MIENIRVMANVPVFRHFGLNAHKIKFCGAGKKMCIMELTCILGLFTGTSGTS
jgi:hypothetical protein